MTRKVRESNESKTTTFKIGDEEDAAFILPIQAPYQETYLGAAAMNTVSHIGQNDRRCTWYPICLKCASDCGGCHMNKFAEFKHRVGDEAFMEEIKQQRKRM